MQYQPETWQEQPAREHRHVRCRRSLWPGDALGGCDERDAQQGDGNESEKDLVLKLWSEKSVCVKRRK